MTPDVNRINLMSQCVAPLLNCPAGGEKPDCPLLETRRLDIIERINWMKKRTEKELARILAHHRKCMWRNAS